MLSINKVMFWSQVRISKLIKKNIAIDFSPFKFIFISIKIYVGRSYIFEKIFTHYFLINHIE